MEEEEEVGRRRKIRNRKRSKAERRAIKNEKGKEGRRKK